jgi:hypothetical protein
MPIGEIWVFDVVAVINIVVLVTTLVLEAWAFLHCALHRGDAFTAVGTLPKGTWLAILGGTILLALVFYQFGLIFTLIAATAALIYLLDIRPGIREVMEGSGPQW